MHRIVSFPASIPAPLRWYVRKTYDVSVQSVINAAQCACSYAGPSTGLPLLPVFNRVGDYCADMGYDNIHAVHFAGLYLLVNTNSDQ